MANPEPGDRPPRSRLDRAPSERYATALPAAGGEGGADPRPSPARGIALAIGAAGLAAGLTVVLAGLLAVSLGLLIVALLTGWLVAEALRAGAGASLGQRRRSLGAGIALAGAVAGQLGVWLFARAEGGALGLGDYLWQTFGWIAPAQLVIAAAAAWWSGR